MRVLIALDNTYKWLWVPLAEQLIKKKNANVLLVTSNESLFKYFEKNIITFKSKIKLKLITNIYDQIINKHLNYKIEYKKILTLEKKYNYPIIKKVIFSDRQLGYKYYISAPNFGKSKITNHINYQNRLNAVKYSFELWENELIDFKPN